jgi:tRNA-uridine 2-sulfurtransferase
MLTNEMNETAPPKPKRVVVAMSGGVDSSVAAALLVEQGYEVIGMMMRLWSEPGKEALNRCCTPDQMADARQIAGQLGIPFYVVDVKDYFRQKIVQFYLDEHGRGRTPNPCLECNREIRFSYLYDRALALSADYLATGHYARIVHTTDDSGTYYQLRPGLDRHKDQSYVLHMLTQEHMAHVLFPVGGYTKPEVRELAAKFGLPTASKGDSMDLCFLAGDDYRNFLRRHTPDIMEPGPIRTVAGELLGEHTGLPNYTIGQRKGLGVNYPEPLFVVGKEAQTNTLLLGTRTQAGTTEVRAERVSWMRGQEPDTAVRALVKIRYKAHALPATITPHGNDQAHISFDDPVFGPTTGQGAVFYQPLPAENDEHCLGGGIIGEL